MTETRARLRRPGSPTWPTVIAIGAGVALVAAGLGALAGVTLTAGPGSCNTESIADRALSAVVAVRGGSGSGARTGSGSIIGADGVILTNAHLLGEDPGAAIEVQLSDGATVPASVVGTDAATDLAVLRIPRTGLPTLRLDPSGSLRLGQPVVALAAPTGASGTVTGAVVSALNRNVTSAGSGGAMTSEDAIQLDAGVQQAGSGGPVVGCDGVQVGVVSAAQDSSTGPAWALPAATAQRVSAALLAGTIPPHAWLGLSVATIPQDVADRFKASSGLFVQATEAGGPAASAGLKAGDIITTIAGSPATSQAWTDLQARVKAGDQLAIGYVREGAQLSASLTLAERPR